MKTLRGPAVFLFIGVFSASAFGQLPPVITIYDINMVEIDTDTRYAGEPFTLIGYAVGDVPLFYQWYRTTDGNPVLIVQSQYLIDYVINDPGDHVITLVVTDVNDLAGSDSVLMTVTGPPVPVEYTTWGRIKALYE